MPIHGTLTISNYMAAQRLHYWLKPWAIALFALIALWLLWKGASWQDWLMAAFAIYMILILAVYVPFRGRRHFRQNKGLSEPMNVEVRDDGIFFANTNSSGLLPWGHIHKWRTNNRITLIYRTSNMFHLIPKEFFSSDDEYHAFVQTLRDHNSAAT